MFGQKFMCFAVLLIYTGNTNVYAKKNTEEEAKMKAVLIPILNECKAEYGVAEIQSMEDVDACLLGCFFKKIKIIDSNGDFDVDAAIELNKLYIKTEEDLAVTENLIKECIKVNEAKVSDGDKGCERSKLLYECFKSKDLLLQ